MKLDAYKMKDYILSFIAKFKSFRKNHKELFLNFKYIFGILICNFLILTIWVNRVNFYPENFRRTFAPENDDDWRAVSNTSRRHLEALYNFLFNL